MTFSSLAFLFVFFPIVFLLYFVCRNDMARNILLIIASLVFYAYGEPAAVFIMLVSILLNYCFGLMCGEALQFGKKNRRKAEIIKKTGLIAAVIMNIGLLFVFKYANFFFKSFGLSDIRLDLALPIGISFFTFQGLSYVIDVYRDKDCLQKNLFSVMLYISFFPQLIAGPIVKYHDIKDQLAKREFSASRIGNGIQRFIFGLGKKMLIAGPMGIMVDKIYSMDTGSIGAFAAWAAAISYIFQIYFDFSGYSDMAIGLGCIFGFDFKENFDKPYAASDMQHFWRKWHISLSTWFRDYVYIPMGGNRRGTVRTYINKFTVFILTGLWHGANWTFVCWGLFHGLALIAEDLVKKLGKKFRIGSSKWLSVLLKIVGHIYALVFITLTFIIFRADDLGYAFRMISRLVSPGGSSVQALSAMDPMYLAALAAAVVFSSTLPDRVMEKAGPAVLRVISVFVFAASIIMLISGGYNPFIYFRF